MVDTGHKALCPVSLTRFIRAYLGVTVGSGHTMALLYEYINYSFPSILRITTLGSAITLDSTSVIALEGSLTAVCHNPEVAISAFRSVA